MKTRRKLNMNLKQITLLLLALFASFGMAMAQTVISFDISKDNVTITDDSYSGQDSSGNTVSGTHDPSYIYEVTGTTDTYSIKIGALGTPVTTNVILRLAGVNIDAPHENSDNHAAALYVNTNAGTVYVILKDNTSNTLKSYGRSNLSGQTPYAHAGIEKEIGTNGKLVVTCETGYSAYLADNTKGHTCTDTDPCGSLTAIAAGDTYRPSGGNLRCFCGAGIGSAGTFSGDGSSLKNLIIAGGKITATALWGHLSGASVTAGEDEASFAPGIGVGAAYGGSNTGSTGYIKITGGKINATAGNGAAACIGGGYRSSNVTIDIYDGNIRAIDRSQNHTSYSGAKYRGPGIGVGGGGEQTGSQGQATVNIYGGTMEAYSEYGAAIGGGAGGANGGGLPATIYIYGGDITANTTLGAGAGIGTGGSTGSGQGGLATVNISQTSSVPTIIYAKSVNGADIGGGGTGSTTTTAVGGKGIVTISGGTITTEGGGIGGGKANAGLGGDAEITISGGHITSTSIGGGNSTTNDGGTATVTVSGTANITLSGGIGGGNSGDASHTTSIKDGGSATVTVSNGSLSCSTVGGGKAFGSGNGGDAVVHITGGSITNAAIGGGDATSGHGGYASIAVSGGSFQGGSIGGGDVTTGTAGDASIYVTGGSLDCESIGGGNATTGIPGSVTGTVQTNPAQPYYNPDGAGIYIAHETNTITVKSGYIGGGSNTASPTPALGFATAYIDAPNGTIQGQFVLTNTDSGRHCFFTLKHGIIDNADLGGVGTGDYPRMRAEGGAVYMSDPHGAIVTIEGGTIRNTHGATLGGAVYMSAGTFNMSGGTIGGTSLSNGNWATQYGGAVYMAGGTFNMTGGSIQYNKAEDNDGGGIYIGPGGTASFNGANIVGNVATNGNGGGFYVDPVVDPEVIVTTPINNTTISGNTAGTSGGGAYIASGEVTLTNSTLSGNTATAGDGGGVWASSNVDIKSSTITGNSATNGTNGRGGGIYTQGTGTVVTLDRASSSAANTVLKDNHARQGGAVYTSATVALGYAVDLQYVTVGESGHPNTASNDGGGIYASGAVNVSSHATVDYNTAGHDGGGVCVGTGGELTLDGGKVRNNTANHDGGGFFVNPGGAKTTTIRNNAELSANTAAHHGGGAYVKSGAVELNTMTLSNNKATNGNGGGVWASSNVNIYSSTIEGNWAAPSATNDTLGCGGGIYTKGSNKVVTLDKATTDPSSPNTVLKDNRARRGGAVYTSATVSSGYAVYLNHVTVGEMVGEVRHGNTATNDGGGIYASGAVYVSSDATVDYNTATNDGGGVCVGEGGELLLDGGNVSHNTAGQFGGGFFVDPADDNVVTLVRNQSYIHHNSAVKGGGAYVASGKLQVQTAAGAKVVDSTRINHNVVTQEGGGVFVYDGNVEVISAILDGNEAEGNGGAIYARDGSVTLTQSTLRNNKSTSNNGGGIYAAGGSVTSNGSKITSNQAKLSGGGVYSASGGAIMVRRSGSTVTKLTSNTAGNGGALYAAGGNVALYNASVTGNHATTGNGGAVCAAFTDAGSVTIGGGTIDNNQTDDAVSNGLGGAIYVSGTSGTIYIQDSANVAPVFRGNSARNGGVLYMSGGTCNLTAGDLGTMGADNGNTASERGGGIYAGGGTINFSNGNIINNYAGVEGGGIFLGAGGTIYLKLMAVIDYNHIPDADYANGGGVYMHNGLLYVGEGIDDALGLHKVKAEHNYKGATYSAYKLNNIYLKENTDVITLLSDISSKTEDAYDSHIGFSVNSGFRPVVAVRKEVEPTVTEGGHTYPKRERWLNGLLISQETVVNTAIFDDTQSYIAIHVSEDTHNSENILFEWNYIYLWSGWNTNVNEPPGTAAIEPEIPSGYTDDPDLDPNFEGEYHIKTPEGLSWFSSLVNGLGTKKVLVPEPHVPPVPEDTLHVAIPAHHHIKGYLEADVDMSGYLWIPIGGVKENSYSSDSVSGMSSIFQPGGKFCGTFDGQGHTVRNIECRYIVNVSEYGLFGNLDGATVKNVFIDDFLYEAQSNSIEYHIGGLAGTVDGTTTISNCEAQGLIDARFSAENSTVGGLVGTVACNSGSIHSSMALANIKGKATHIGGLIGDMMYGSSLKNSFANTVVDVTTNDASQHVGGLVGRNIGGTVSNCYSVMQPGAGGEGYYGTGSSSNYGALVAENQGSGNDYVRISDLSELTEGSQVILAARYNSTATDYLAVRNMISSDGKAYTTPFTSWTIPTAGDPDEVEVARELVLDDNDYYWTVHKTADDKYIFTNFGDSIAYNSADTSFYFYPGYVPSAEVDKTKWTVALGTTETALVSGYNGFTITNVNDNTHGFGIHKAADNKYYCAAYAVSNNTNANYNFCFDIFKRGTPTIKGTVEYSYACCLGDTTAIYGPSATTSYTESSKQGNLTQQGYVTKTYTDESPGKYGFLYKGQRVHLASGTDDGAYVTSSTNGIMEFTDDGGYRLKGLLVALNAWVTDHPEALSDGTHYSRWTRTMASPINDDYPVLMFNDFQCLGSKTGSRFIDYRADTYKDSGSKASEFYKSALDSLIVEYRALLLGGAIYPFEITDNIIKESTGENVRVYLEPTMMPKQAAGVKTNARVGIVFDNSLSPAEAIALAGQPYDWHMFATPFTDAPLGLTYHSTYGDVDEPHYTSGDSYTPAFNSIPPQVTIEAGCYFPSDTPYGWPYTDESFDFYCYDELSRHWINFKREGAVAANSSTGSDVYDHWHADELWPGGPHCQIMYENETKLVNGKGYLMAVSQPTLLSADGTLRNIDFRYTPAYHEEGDGDYGGIYYEALAGINLVGNPYYGYLDFNAFAVENPDYKTYYILDADKRGYISYTHGASPTADLAPNYISPHQGFFVKAPSQIDIKFTTDMSKTLEEVNTAVTTAGHPEYMDYYYFRGEPVAYPLVNLVSTDSKGMCEYATIELDRPEYGGGEKLMMRTGTASMYFHIEDTDYQIAFVPECVKSAPVRFEVIEDDTYTFTWSTANGNFTYLHLIDNITGMDIDCLTHSEYKFEGHTTDYKSRFRLEFDYEIDEPEDDDDENAPFAFMMGNELVVNGEGVLQVFDVLGRQIMGKEMQGIQSTVILPVVADGVYVLRLTTGSVTKTQKLVINK